MKKIIFTLALAMLCISCTKSDKCKCKLELKSADSKFELTEDELPPIDRPEDATCASLKIEDIKGDYITVEMSKFAKVKCRNFNE